LASLNKNVITLDFARESLRDLLGKEEPKLDIDIIQQHVAESFHIRLIDLRSKKRTQHLAFCRQVAMYLCRKLTSSSFPAIGAGFGRDHSTVIHAYNLIARRVDNDGAFRVLMQKIERQLKSPPSDVPYQQSRKTQTSSELVAQQHQI
jgi:chromosomal replication initiator protein